MDFKTNLAWSKSLCLAILLLIFGTLSLTGCAAKGQKFVDFAKPGDDEALIYIYTPYAFWTRNAITYKIAIKTENSGKFNPIGTLRSGGYLMSLVKANQNITIFTSKGGEPISLFTMPSQIYCVGLDPINIPFNYLPKFKPISTAICKERIQDTSYSY